MNMRSLLTITHIQAVPLIEVATVREVAKGRMLLEDLDQVGALGLIAHVMRGVVHLEVPETHEDPEIQNLD